MGLTTRLALFAVMILAASLRIDGLVFAAFAVLILGTIRRLLRGERT